MALAETQALLAQLFTDAALRREFFAAPEDVAIRHGLTEAEAARLARIDRLEVESFARTLLSKRVLDLRKMMPLTATALGPRFDALLTNSAQPLSGARHHADVAALVGGLRELSTKGEVAPWQVDIARYEHAFVDAMRPCLTLLRFDHDIASIVVALRAEAPVKAAPRKTFGIWARAKGGRLRFRLFGCPVFTLGGRLR